MNQTATDAHAAPAGPQPPHTPYRHRVVNQTATASTATAATASTASTATASTANAASRPATPPPLPATGRGPGRGRTCYLTIPGFFLLSFLAFLSARFSFRDLPTFIAPFFSGDFSAI